MGVKPTRFCGPIRAIFFDFDGTLADDGDSIVDALTQACRIVCRRWPEINITELIAAYRRASDMAWGDFDRYLRPLPSPEAMLAAVWHQTLTNWGLCDSEVEREAADVYWQFRLHHCRPYPDVLPLLEQLTGHFHLSVLTNGAPAMQRAKLEATGLGSFFRQVFVGGEFAQGKPAPLIFRAALEAAQCRPDQAVHIGDSLIHDVAGALRVGIHSVWLKRKGGSVKDLDAQVLDRVQGATPDYEITSLSALPTCLVHLMQHPR